MASLLLGGCIGTAEIAGLPRCRGAESPDSLDLAAWYSDLPSVSLPDSLTPSTIVGRYISSDGHGGYHLDLRQHEPSTRRVWTHMDQWPFTLLRRDTERVIWELDGAQLVLLSAHGRCLRAERLDVISVDGQFWLVREREREYVRAVLAEGLELFRLVAPRVDEDVYIAIDDGDT